MIVAEAGATLGTATGLDRIGTPTVFELPHTGGNYLLREMIHVVGRKHAAKLRRIAIGLGFGLPFLTSGHLDLHLPLIGDVPLASAIGFDIGVYLVVFGGAMLMLSMMGTIKPSRTRAARKGEIDLQRRSARTGEMH